jgi:hypothetical protein
MNDIINFKIKSIAKEIRLGQVDHIQYLETLMGDSILTKDDYIELMVRTLFLSKIKQNIEDKKERDRFWLNSSIVLTCYLLIKYLL